MIAIRKNWLFWFAAFLGLLFDRITKLWVVTHFSLKETLSLWPEVFHFTYVVNRGAAFGWLQGQVWLRWVSLLVSLVLIYVGLTAPSLRRWDQLGYGFLLSGALGNGVDRFISGHVVDFLDFRLINFAIFNLADVFINVGLICLCISLFQKPTPKKY
jgi:signal peptidase II